MRQVVSVIKRPLHDVGCHGVFERSNLGRQTLKKSAIGERWATVGHLVERGLQLGPCRTKSECYDPGLSGGVSSQILRLFGA